MEQLMNLDESIKKLSPEQQQQMIAGMRQEAVLTNLQNLITILTDKCTTKCISNPGSMLSGGEKQCLQRCMDRFMESWDVVTRSLNTRIQQEISKVQNSSTNLMNTNLNDLSGSLAGTGFSSS